MTVSMNLPPPNVRPRPRDLGYLGLDVLPRSRTVLTETRNFDAEENLRTAAHTA
jgi:hypothetical protein